MSKPRAFTLIELLVVVAIISLLMSILLPSLNHARKQARAMASMATLNGWGKGTLSWTFENGDVLPFEGKKQPVDMAGSGGLGNPAWWANAVPPYMGAKSYQQMVDMLGDKVPIPPDKSVFVDPAAKPARDAPYTGGTSSNRFKFYFSYVVNSELDNSITQKYGPPGYQKERMPLGRISRTGATVMMIELRATNEELSPDDRYHDGINPSTGDEIGLKRCRGDFKYLAKRYKNGTHILFCDGHVAHVDYAYATTPSDYMEKDTNPSNSTFEEEVQTWNKGDLIWNPLGATTEE
ncbi:MAG: type II secretion system protein [Phycisphaerae bacterium]|nr:type II secretion system protein [Phycisphaerae bacterium]